MSQNQISISFAGADYQRLFDGAKKTLSKLATGTENALMNGETIGEVEIAGFFRPTALPEISKALKKADLATFSETPGWNGPIIHGELNLHSEHIFVSEYDSEGALIRESTMPKFMAGRAKQS